MLRKLLLITTVFLFSGCAENHSTDCSPTVGSCAPQIEGTAVDGSFVNLEDLKGKYVIVEFYASWCGPCHRELPKLKQLYTDKKNTAQPVEVISIALEKSKKTGAKFLSQIEFPWKQQILKKSNFVRFDEDASAYDVTDIPASFLIGPDGSILAAHSSIDQIQAILESL
jgi:thiol-disulfide isomerase/thioredoxin